VSDPLLEDFQIHGKFSLVTGISKKSQEEAHDLRWVSPFDKKYPGIKKLVRILLKKVEYFECRMPLYLEPFRPSSDSLQTLFKEIEPEIGTTSLLVPKYISLIKYMDRIKQFSLYSQLETELLDLCYERSAYYPFVYLFLCHYLKDAELITNVFVGYKDKTIPLNILKTGYQYTHYGIQQNYSTDLEGYINTNYNRAYLHTLLGTSSGGIGTLFKKIKQSKDGCHYVLLRYALSIDSTKPSNYV
jgi:hypothetical protein